MRTLACVGMLAALTGCSLQPEYSSPVLAMPEHWTSSSFPQPTTFPPGADTATAGRWWTALHDPAIDALVVAAFRDSPAVDEVMARTDEARAVLRGAAAGRVPSLQANASGTRQQAVGAAPGETQRSSVADAGVSVGYELDVFGRVRESVRAAENRVAARSAEVQGARLTLVAQIADGVVALRSCAFSQRVRALDIASRAQVLELTRRRVAAGMDARVEAARATNSLASAHIDAALLKQQCEGEVNALVALTGLGGADVRGVVLAAGGDAVGAVAGDAVKAVAGDAVGAVAGDAVGAAAGDAAAAVPPDAVGAVAADAVGAVAADAVGAVAADAVRAVAADADRVGAVGITRRAESTRPAAPLPQTTPLQLTPPFMPVSPSLVLPLPATVLIHHPDLLAADRDAAAAWSDIGVARAARLPRIDLGAMLTGNWMRVAGSTLSYTTWSLGPTLAAPLFDGGAGASNVDAGEARYRAAVARLRQAVRRVVQDVEQALAAEDSARVRVAAAQEGLGAARETFLVTERRWRAGATSLFELEDARRQRSAAEDAAIAAARDHVQAWIALMKAIGAPTQYE